MIRRKKFLGKRKISLSLNRREIPATVIMSWFILLLIFTSPGIAGQAIKSKDAPEMQPIIDKAKTRRPAPIDLRQPEDFESATFGLG